MIFLERDYCVEYIKEKGRLQLITNKSIRIEHLSMHWSIQRKKGTFWQILSGLKPRPFIVCQCDENFDLLCIFQPMKSQHYSGAVGGKTGKTTVLPRFSKIEGGSGGGVPQWWSYLTRARVPATLLNYNCSIFLDLRNLQLIKHSVTRNCSDLSLFT